MGGGGNRASRDRGRAIEATSTLSLSRRRGDSLRRRGRSGSAPKHTTREKNSRASSWGSIPKRNGEGMTIWWLNTVLLTLIARFEAPLRQWLFSLDIMPKPAFYSVVNWLLSTSQLHETVEQNALALLKGVAAASGLCVGVGYYTFKAAFRYCHGSMSTELWQANNLHRVGFPYWLFLCLDLAVHVLGVVYTAYRWGANITPLAVLITFVIHRLWSLVHSTGRTVYYTEVHTVYGFKEMPSWSFIALYGSEAITLGYCLYNACQSSIQCL